MKKLKKNQSNQTFNYEKKSLKDTLNVYFCKFCDNFKFSHCCNKKNNKIQ
jgi:hypothetical protein